MPMSGIVGRSLLQRRSPDQSFSLALRAMKLLLLTMVSASAIVLLFITGPYRTWFRDRPLDYWNSFRKEFVSHASPEAIRRARYGNAYVLSMAIKDTILQQQIQDPVLLLEPNSYYKDSLHMDLHMPEPAVFYYYTGLHSVWMNSPNVQKANCLVRIVKGLVHVSPIRNPEQLRQIIDS